MERKMEMDPNHGEEIEFANSGYKESSEEFEKLKDDKPLTEALSKLLTMKDNLHSIDSKIAKSITNVSKSITNASKSNRSSLYVKSIMLSSIKQESK